jgi:hypothetical protein
MSIPYVQRSEFGVQRSAAQIAGFAAFLREQSRTSLGPNAEGEL